MRRVNAIIYFCALRGREKKSIIELMFALFLSEKKTATLNGLPQVFLGKCFIRWLFYGSFVMSLSTNTKLVFLSLEIYF